MVFRLLRLLFGAIVIVGVALVAWGYAEATRQPVVVRHQFTIDDWPAGTPPMRIVQLSDIHYGWPDMPASRIARIVAQVNALEPDLILLSGDYMGGKVWDHDIGNMDDAIRPLRLLRARYGVIAVRGNHDGQYWTPIVFARTPIKLLQGRWARVGPIVVAGLDDLMTAVNPAHAAGLAIKGAPAGVPVVVVAHEPDFFQWMPKRVALFVAGHTHGGQIVLPLLGHRTISPYLDAHRRGVFREGGQTMLVSSGLGTSIVPLRIGVPPEIVEFTLGGYSVGRKSGTDR